MIMHNRSSATPKPELASRRMHDRADTPSQRIDNLLATAVVERRRVLHLSQSELAALAGVSIRTVHSIEAGKRTIRLDVVQAVLNTLGLRLEVSRPGGGG